MKKLSEIRKRILTDINAYHNFENMDKLNQKSTRVLLNFIPQYEREYYAKILDIKINLGPYTGKYAYETK